MKAQVFNNRIVATGELIGNPAGGVYTLVGEMPETGTPTFEIIGDEVHITGVAVEPETIAGINATWQQNYKDYKQAKKAMQDIVNKRGFVTMPHEEQVIAAKWFVATEAEINSVLTFEEQLAAKPHHNEQSRASRKRRYYLAYEYFETALGSADAMKVIGSIMQHNLEYFYTVLGFEGKGTFNYKGVEDQVSILDFINSTPGTKFETAGLASLGLTPQAVTVQQLITTATNLIKHGDY